MANVKDTSGGVPKWTVDTTGQVALGDAARAVVGTMVVQIVGTGFTGSVVPKARVAGSGATALPIPYRRRVLGAAASDDTTVSAAITGDAIITIEADGLDVFLDVTVTLGSIVVYFRPLRG